MNAYIELGQRMEAAQLRYGSFASTHEALGVACEEWTELIDAIRLNDLRSIRHECLDLAAVLMRMVEATEDNENFKKRSVK